MLIVLTAPLNSFTGYGQLALELFARLTSQGHEVRLNPVEIHEQFMDIRCPLPGVVREAILPEKQRGALKCDVELVIVQMEQRVLPGTMDRSVCFSMWETTQISPQMAAALNRYQAVIVPCRMNVETLSASGVTVPVHQVPLGVEPEIYNDSSSLRGLFSRACFPITFGTATNFAKDGHRKNTPLAVRCFTRAFHSLKDVRLEVKCFPGDPLPPCTDDRVTFLREFWPTHKLAEWYGTLDAYVVTSRGEGWGLMPHQAMATGVPVIGPMFGGLAEFLTAECGYPVFAKLSPSSSMGGGMEAVVDEDALIEQMRRVYFDRPEALVKGRLSALRAAEFTWDRTAAEVEKVLRDVVEQPVYSVVIPTLCRNAARKAKGFKQTATVKVADTVRSLLAGGVPKDSITVVNSGLMIGYAPSPTHVQALVDVTLAGVKIELQQSEGMYLDCLHALRLSDPRARYALFIEDDVEVTHDFHARLLAWLEAHHWPKAATFINWNKLPDGALLEPDQFWGSQCFAIERELVDQMPAAAFPYPDENHDRTWAHVLGGLGVKIMVCAPSLAQHTGGDSSTRVEQHEPRGRVEDFQL